MPPGVKIAPGSKGHTVRGFLFLNHVKNPRVVVDLGTSGKTVALTFPAGCTTAGTKVTCVLPDTPGDDEVEFAFVVKAKAGVAVGATATINFTIRADGFGPVVGGATTFTADDGVDLVLREFDNQGQEFTPNQRFGLTVAMKNVGNRDAVGLRISFGIIEGLVPDRFPNCRYQRTYPQVSCDVAETVEAGGEVEMEPFGFGFTKDAMGFKGVAATVEGIEEDDPAAKELAQLAKVDGKKFGVAKRSGKAAARAANELNPNDNVGVFVLEVKNTFDAEALGSTAKGKVGDVVKVTVGARNHGPGSVIVLGGPGGDEASFRYFFTVPPGTTVVAVPNECAGIVKQGDRYVRVGDPGAPFYACNAEVDAFRAGTTSTRQFSLKITQVIDNATGTVTFQQSFIPEDNPEPNTNPANDKASVIINPTGGGLPVTGAKTGAVLALGAVLLATGGGLYLAARRRRVVLVTPAE